MRCIIIIIITLFLLYPVLGLLAEEVSSLDDTVAAQGWAKKMAKHTFHKAARYGRGRMSHDCYGHHSPEEAREYNYIICLVARTIWSVKHGHPSLH